MNELLNKISVAVPFWKKKLRNKSYEVCEAGIGGAASPPPPTGGRMGPPDPPRFISNVHALPYQYLQQLRTSAFILTSIYGGLGKVTLILDLCPAIIGKICSRKTSAAEFVELFEVLFIFVYIFFS